MSNVSDLVVGKGSDDLAESGREENQLAAPGLNEAWSGRIKAGAATMWDDVATRLASLRPNGRYGSTMRYALVAALIFLGLATRWGLHSFFGGDFPFEFFFVVIAFAAGVSGVCSGPAAGGFWYVLAGLVVFSPPFKLGLRAGAGLGGGVFFFGG